LGIARRFSFTALSASTKVPVSGTVETAPKSRYTGKRDVNQPTVRETSTSRKRSSLPCPSRSKRTLDDPVQAESVWANAVNNTSLMWVWYTEGTSSKRAFVSSGESSAETTRLEATVLGRVCAG